ncbi:hypothetical protein CWE13_04705 [Aliidiomarina shirensis]|uniref:Uncharacterized protein n=1 Tax=Aliidiomarina shirensis TaxID=1048642 RepID=A0A432WU38_9GAMM|nr:hypothetical protein CWE13_04705 [Aliidiomarina shirensis]
MDVLAAVLGWPTALSGSGECLLLCTETSLRLAHPQLSHGSAAAHSRPQHEKSRGLGRGF